MSFKIAIYGKGGIGKSTISANLSYALSAKGLKVLQIGCDPKHDSSRLLLGDHRPVTVLDYVMATAPSDRKLDDIMYTGEGGVMCIEAGGPKPGVGCAGKGILTMFQTLESLGADNLDIDVVIYDVLGDVVCGGFAVPMRHSHADVVYIVTSGEPMSLYAANNIMRGSLNFDDSAGRVAGLILNRRDVPNERVIVNRFAESTGMPIVADLRRSELFALSDRDRVPLCRLYPGSQEAEAIDRLAADIVALINKKRTGLPTTHPLTDEEFDILTSGGTVGTGTWTPAAPSSPGIPAPPTRYPARGRIGKGAIGAVLTAGRVSDVPVIVHGTTSCGFTMVRELMEQRIDWIRSGQRVHVTDIACTSMSPDDVVMGGAGRLNDAMEEVLLQGHSIMVVIAACLPGMIGDDCSGVKREFERKHPGTHVLMVESGRVTAGSDSHIELMNLFAELADQDVEPDPLRMVVVDDVFDWYRSGSNQVALMELVDGLGISLAPGFLDECSVEDVVNLKRAGVATLGSGLPTDTAIRRTLEGMGMRFVENRVPRGYGETVAWVTEVGEITGKTAEAASLVSKIENEYSQAVIRMSELLHEKRIAVITMDPETDSWMAETLNDVDSVEANLIVVGPQSGDRVATLNAVENSDTDLAIGRRDLTDGLTIPCMEPPGTCISHRASIMLMERVWNVIRSDKTLAWRTWGCPTNA